MIDLPSYVTEDDFEWLLEEIDPDWKDHFIEVEHGIAFYQNCEAMDHALEALKEQK